MEKYTSEAEVLKELECDRIDQIDAKKFDVFLEMLSDITIDVAHKFVENIPAFGRVIVEWWKSKEADRRMCRENYDKRVEAYIKECSEMVRAFTRMAETEDDKEKKWAFVEKACEFMQEMKMIRLEDELREQKEYYERREKNSFLKGVCLGGVGSTLAFGTYILCKK